METSKMVIDSSIFIQHLRAKNKFNTILRDIPNDKEIFISPITIYELLMGATTSAKWNDVEKLIEGVPVLPFTENVSKRAGSIFHELKNSHRLIEFRDIFIAATALTFEVSVLTINTKDFKRIKGVNVIDGLQMNF